MLRGGGALRHRVLALRLPRSIGHTRLQRGACRGGEHRAVQGLGPGERGLHRAQAPPELPADSAERLGEDTFFILCVLYVLT